MKYSFSSDYNQLCAKEILEYLQKIASQQFNGYSIDEINESAKNRIKDLCQRDCDVHFLVGGTQTNAIVISACCRDYQAAVSVETGHINVHETGAIENTGHKVCLAKGIDGKLTPEELEKVILMHTDEHMVMPKVAYISNSTEIGTIYKKAELEGLREMCDRYGLYLFLDGARLGAALTCPENDLTIADIARLTDVFYIGGTKNGAMLGEALVITNDTLKKDFRYYIKQKGAMLAKGFLLGAQFDCLFTNDLFFTLARHENAAAQYLADQLKQLKVRFLVEPTTNQLFVILANEVLKTLSNDYLFNIWEEGPTESCIRLVTNFAADYQKLDEFVDDVRKLLTK